jgi:hypothetical protein
MPNLPVLYTLNGNYRPRLARGMQCNAECNAELKEGSYAVLVGRLYLLHLVYTLAYLHKVSVYDKYVMLSILCHILH